MRSLDAGAFTFVMATGVVSVAASGQRFPILSDVLLSVAVSAWAALTVVVALRRRRGRPRPQALAFVAATTVIGARVSDSGAMPLALALLTLGVVAWSVLLFRSELARPGADWLLVVVATESLAVLAATLAPRFGDGLLVAALAWWGLGLLLYLPVSAAAVTDAARGRGFTPDLWVLMGALAITTLAGAEIVLAGRPWMKDGALAAWAAASAWLLPLVVAELRMRSRWGYRASRWSFVFPLGMYSVASQTLAQADSVPPLHEVGRVAFFIALGAWTLVLVGLVRRAAGPTFAADAA